MQAPVTGSIAFLLFCHPYVSRFGSRALLLSCLESSTYPLPFFPCSEIPTALLFRLVPFLVSGSLAVLLPFSVLGHALSYLAYTALKTFKLTLADKSLRRRSISFVELLCLFSLFGLLSDKIDRKLTFDTAFINSHLLAGNNA